MDRSSISRILIIVAIAALFFQFGLPKLTGGDGPRTQPIVAPGTAAPTPRAPEALCALEGNRFKAQLSTQGATLKSWQLAGKKYSADGREGSPPLDLVTTPDHEKWRPLRTELWSKAEPASAEVARQVRYDLFDWKLEPGGDGKACVFTYEDEQVALRKTVRAGARPFEVEAELSVENRGPGRAAHRAAFETTAWRTEKEIEGGFGRQSPFVTQVECSRAGKLTRKLPGDFAPKEFSKPEFKHGWLVPEGGAVDFAAVSNFYFSQALVPLAGPPGAEPVCELQIEERWNDQAFGAKKDDPQAGSLYRARLAWPRRELGPGERAEYKLVHFVGPKERDVLAAAGGRGLGDLIDLGTFAVIAKVLVSFLIFCHRLLGSWGLAIMALTISVRVVLFPLMWKTIQSGLKMRMMKPEIDEINRKYADDPQQKQLATMELWKKHKVNPVAGCLPTLAQMPVWFALYTALQTAAELYHTPFLWFRDLSAPDTVRVGSWEVPFLLPLLLGATTFVQQKIMPQQMDPVQQKMMSYMMPLVFTAMMLFLPSGLGVYMLTSSLLGIAQQLAVERYYDSKTGGKGGGIGVRDKAEAPKEGAVGLALGKGKARV
ncbi:MAG TPA: membrane protein insertase YidC [Polyangiaceae bacterium]|nr:membrane protein insertase YidC [Polyangiaceae bacterium]